MSTRLNDILSLINENTTFDINENDCNGLSGGTSITYDDYQENSASSAITSNHDAICCRASESCYQASSIVTESNNGTIVCSGSESCFDTPLISTGTDTSYTTGFGNIFCFGHTSCRQSILYAGLQGGMIICGSKRSCRDSIILSAKYVFCLATQEGCNGIMIKNVENIYLLSGPSSANDNARIVSNGGDIETVGIMNVYLASKAAGDDVKIFCNSTDNCYIECLTNGACERTNLTCDGNCTIYCNPTRSIECPSIVSALGSVYYVSEPTSQPTNQPTNLPSFGSNVEPSSQPSQMPVAFTVQPTSIPQNAPSIFPTDSGGTSNS